MLSPRQNQKRKKVLLKSNGFKQDFKLGMYSVFTSRVHAAAPVPTGALGRAGQLDPAPAFPGLFALDARDLGPVAL